VSGVSRLIENLSIYYYLVHVVCKTGRFSFAGETFLFMVSRINMCNHSVRVLLEYLKEEEHYD
jgi:hypothetical protein